MSTLSDVKELAKLIQDLGKIELYKKVVDLQSDIVELTEERNRLREENRVLKEKKDIRERLRFDTNLYWLKESDKEIGPFCQQCMDSGGKLVRLIDYGHREYLECSVCKKRFKTTYRPISR